MTAPSLPAALREKLNPDGTYQPYAGNTIICHIDPKSALFEALKDVHAQLGERSFSAKLSPLPLPSYHVTIFGGANDKHRRAGAWPEFLPFDIPITECNAALQKRLQDFDLGCDLPLRLRVSPEAVHETEMALRLELQPLDETENQKLRGVRNRLFTLLGIRVPGHNEYAFHISLAYVIGAFTPDELNDYRISYAEWRDMIASRAPVIELGAPEFCVFKDMRRFERKMYLGVR